ncbi:MAG TPA: helix-hairpin-helix domain-containing protein, partial [Sandaracinaceae bacterium LLY-WYZ-13_1]|nr:helix-hairpin-helix domain-containing protein [Sandaracinaceae bacterium LLY-WYZ-13_1]
MSRAPHRSTNEEIACDLEEASELLRVQGADRWRVRAFREAAHTLRTLREPVVQTLDRGGRDALVALPTIGRSIAAAIEEMAHRGRWSMLDRLRGEVSPEEVLMTVPGMGETLAHRVHEALGIETLEDLEVAAHDGRLEQVPGFGPRRARAVREVLASQLARSTRRRARRAPSLPPAPPLESY